MDWHEVDTLPPLGPVAMQQHATYGEACVTGGGQVLRFVAGPRRDPFGSAQVLVRRWPCFGDFGLLARGPVWREDVTLGEARLATRALVRQLRRRLRGVITTPALCGGADPLDGAALLPFMTAGAVARLPLSGGPGGRLARQHGKWRNRLRQAQSAGLRLQEDRLSEDGLHWLLLREAAQARARRYRRLPPRFTQAWRAANGPGAVRVFTAHADGEPVAGMLFLRHGMSATYHVGWAGAQGRATNAHCLLLWQAAERFAEEGCRWIDLGTLDTERTPGLARFKLGSGALPCQFGRTWLEAPAARGVAWLMQGNAGSASGRAHVAPASFDP